MAFHGAGSLNGIAKRSQGQEWITLVSGVAGISQSVRPITIYKSNPGTNQLIDISGPQSLAIAAGGTSANNISTNFNSTLMAAGNASAPFLQIYSATNGIYSLFQSILSVTSRVNSVQFSPDGTKLAAGLNNTPYLTIYNTTNFTSIPVPNGILAAATNNISWSSDSQTLIAATGNSPYTAAFYVTNTTATYLTTSSFNVISTVSNSSVAWSPIDPLMALGYNNFINVYYYSGTGTNRTFTLLPGGRLQHNIGSSNSLTFNNTSSGAITTSSLTFMPGTSNPPLVYNFSLANSSTTITSFSSTPVIGGQNAIVWSNDGQYVFYNRISPNGLLSAKRVGNSFVTSGTFTITNFQSNFTPVIQSIDVNSATNLITIYYGQAPYITQLSFNKSTGNFTDVDCWNRVSQGYTTSSFVPLSGAFACNVARWNPGGSNPPGSVLVTGINTTPSMNMFYYNADNKTFTAFTATSSATNVGTINQATWSPNGQVISVTGTTTPYLNNYYVSGAGTSTYFYKLAQPIDFWNAPLPNLNPGGFTCYSPDGSVMIQSGSSTAPFVACYSVNYNGTATTFTRFTSTSFIPALPSTLTTEEFAFSPDGTKLAIITQQAPILKLYDVVLAGTATTFTSSTGVLSTVPTGTITRVKWSNDGKYVAAIGSTTAGVRDAWLYYVNPTTSTIQLVSGSVINPSVIDLADGYFTNDSATLGIVGYPGLPETPAPYPFLYFLKRPTSGTTETWTTATAIQGVNIDIPLEAINTDWRLDI